MKSTRRYPRLGMVSALAMVMASGMGCAMQSESPTDSAATASTEQFISVHLATAPTFTASTGAVVVAMADETAEIYINAADSSLMVNGVQAIDSSTTPPTVAIAAGKSANIKTVTVSDSSANVGDVVILNYVNGVFGLGGTGLGTTVTLTAAKANTLVVKGTPNADSFSIGPSGISLTVGAKTPTLDIVPSNLSAVSFFLGAGDDTFTSNATVTGGVYGSAVSIYGGAGNDTLVESALSTPSETFSGGPGTDTVDYSKRPVATALVGTFAVNNGSTAVVGTSTAFTTALVVGDSVIFGSQSGSYYRVSAIADDTHLTLGAAYTGTTAAAAAGSLSNAVSVAIDAAGVKKSGFGMWATACTPGATLEGDIILDADVIKGTPGDDQLMGGAAGTSDTLNGGLGNDTFCEGAAANAADTLVGGGGVDVVDYSGRSASLTVVMDGKTKSGDPTANSNAGEGDVVGTDVSNVKLGSGGGTYTGNALNNKFFAGTAGSPTVNGLDGDDTLDEGTNANNAGNETFHGGKGIDTVDYSKRSNALSVTMDGTTHSGDGSEADVIDVDVENLYGGTNGDTLIGNALDNDIEGNGASAGHDVLAGLGGNDTLVGSGPAPAGTIKAYMHGNDVADTAEPGAFNMCLNTGSAGTPLSSGAATTANCELFTQ